MLQKLLLSTPVCPKCCALGRRYRHKTLVGAVGTLVTNTGVAGSPKGQTIKCSGRWGRGLVSPRPSDGLNWVLGLNTSPLGRVKMEGL